MNYRLAQAAMNDVREIALYYERKQRGSGLRFAKLLELTCAAICEQPFLGRPMSARTRRWLMDVFPYIVFYRVKTLEVLIVRIVHEKRDPKVWKEAL